MARLVVRRQLTPPTGISSYRSLIRLNRAYGTVPEGECNAKSNAKNDSGRGHVPAVRAPKSLKSTEYIPQTSYQRVTYEYPPPPEEAPFKPAESSAFRRHLPVLIGLAGALWAVYAYKYIYNSRSKASAKLLDPESFTPFKITYREEIAPGLIALELSPRYAAQKEILRKGNDIWNGKKLWSVEVKQPQIQVVRKYTPLPIFYQQYKDGQETKVLRRLLGSVDEDDGRMVILVKKYEDGEVSRYLHSLSVGDEVELRGPEVGYRFPYSPIDSTDLRDMMQDLPSRMRAENSHPAGLPEPENIAFFAGGTGIAPILQALFSKNPPRGFVEVHYSVRDRREIPFSRFLLFLEKAGRAKFHYYVDSEGRYLGVDDIPEPRKKNYSEARIDADTEKGIERELKLQKIMKELRHERGLPEPQSEGSEKPETEMRDTGKLDLETKKEPSLVDSVNLVGSLANRDPTDLSEPSPRRKFRSILEQVADKKEKGEIPNGPSIAVVCGPEGYVKYVSGPRGPKGTEPVRGLLGAKGWSLENTSRMEA